MPEAYVELECPDCEKVWEEKPHRLPNRRETYTCPDCDAQYTIAEFARDKRDLEVIEEFQ